MENKQQIQPKNIFEQILLGQQIMNENIIALSENLNVLKTHLETLINAMSTTETFEPNASGAKVEK